MDTTDPTTPPHLSADRAWRWDGTQWTPNAPEPQPTHPSARSWTEGRWATAGIVVTALVLAGGLYFAGDIVTGLGLIVMWLVIGLGAMLFLLLPVVIANQRKHHQLGLIAVFSALGLIPFLGWVFWIIALVMAAATSPTPAQQVVTFVPTHVPPHG